MVLTGIDPGKNTGYAVLDTEGMKILHMGIHEDSPFEMLDRVESNLEGVLVVERFVARFGQAFDCTPMYLIGALQGVYESEINLVLPATHKAAVPRDKVTALMKSQGFKVAAGHSRDALSLCLYWAGFKAKDPNVLDWLSKES